MAPRSRSPSRSSSSSSSVSTSSEKLSPLSVTTTSTSKAQKRKELILRAESIIQRIKREHENRHHLLGASVNTINTKQTRSLPLHWKNNEANFIVDLDLNVDIEAQEYRSAEKRLTLTLPTAKVLKVQRIQNATQWLNYNAKRETVLHEGGQEVTEVFHGTRSTSPDKIAMSPVGFDPKLGTSVVGVVWFASDAHYSACGYSYVNSTLSQDHHQTCEQLLLCNILRNAKPPRAPSTDVGQPGQIHEIREACRCLPTHIISYVWNR